jgi:alpha-N-arabinofuranosidase
MTYTPRTANDLAGMVLLQNEDYNFVFGKTLVQGRLAVVLTRAEKTRAVIASAFVPEGDLRLKVEGKGRYYDFYYALPGGDWQLLCRGADAINLSTGRSGGFIGVCIGLYNTSKR